jgi:hypothetical protein
VLYINVVLPDFLDNVENEETAKINIINSVEIIRSLTIFTEAVSYIAVHFTGDLT